MSISSLPNEILTKILMMLDGQTLHTVRQVNSIWNSLIKSEIMQTAVGKNIMERTLQFQWTNATPSITETTFEIYPTFKIYNYMCVLTYNEKFAVILSKLHMNGYKVSLVNIKERMEVPKLCCTTSNQTPGILLTKDVLLIVNWSVGERKILAWNFHTKKEIFNEKLNGHYQFPSSLVIVDHHNQRVMVGKNTKLIITDITVTKTYQPSLPDNVQLKAFSHPHYLTYKEPNHLTGGYVAGWTLWTLDGTLSKTANFGNFGSFGSILEPVFCPSKKIVVFSFGFDSAMWLRVFSTQTGQNIKKRYITVPTMTVGHHDQPTLNANHLVIVTKQDNKNNAILDGKNTLLLYELNTILSQSTDQEIFPRIFQISQNFFNATQQIYLNKTSLIYLLKTKGKYRKTVKFISIDFWNTDN